MGEADKYKQMGYLSQESPRMSQKETLEIQNAGL